MLTLLYGFQQSRLCTRPGIWCIDVQLILTGKLYQQQHKAIATGMV